MKRKLRREDGNSVQSNCNRVPVIRFIRPRIGFYSEEKTKTPNEIPERQRKGVERERRMEKERKG